MTEERYWHPEKESNYYTILKVSNKLCGMAALKSLFTDAKADDMNFVLFSTSGIHGSHITIEDAEQAINNKEDILDVTFLVVQPRIVSLRYGNCTPETLEDIQFLKTLRETSMKAVAEIGF